MIRGERTAGPSHVLKRHGTSGSDSALHRSSRGGSAWRRRHSIWSLFAWAVLGAVGLGACGYRAGFGLGEGLQVGVALFDNTSHERDIERDLHAQLTDSVQRLVASPLVSPGRADYRIEGRVVEYRRRSGIRNLENERLESGVQIIVQARLVRAVAPGGHDADGAENVVREITVSDERGFLFADPLGEAQARDEVLRNVADRIVIDLMADLAWDESRRSAYESPH